MKNSTIAPGAFITAIFLFTASGKSDFNNPTPSIPGTFSISGKANSYTSEPAAATAGFSGIAGNMPGINSTLKDKSGFATCFFIVHGNTKPVSWNYSTGGDTSAGEVGIIIADCTPTSEAFYATAMGSNIPV